MNIFFFKQKTAYEMRISDWSSDVCSSDLRLAALAGRLGLAVPIAEIAAPGAAREIFPEALPVLPLARSVTAEPGRLDPANAEAVLESIRTAVSLALDGAAAAVVTNPIHKQVLKIGRASCGKECVRSCRSRWSPSP